MQRVFLLAQTLGEPIDPRLGLRDWPWSWVRVALYVQKIKNVYEWARIVNRDNPELAIPLRHVIFDDEKLDEWIAGWSDGR